VGEESAFRENVKEKADPSGKRRLRDGNLSVFPQIVHPRDAKSEEAARGNSTAFVLAEMGSPTVRQHFVMAAWPL
jgi:hypothetical protein